MLEELELERDRAGTLTRSPRTFASCAALAAPPSGRWTSRGAVAAAAVAVDPLFCLDTSPSALELELEELAGVVSIVGRSANAARAPE